MKREFLKELGIEGEAIEKIMAENGKDIEKAKGSSEENAAKVKQLEAETKSLKDTIAERDTQLEELKKTSGDNKELQAQIDKLTADNKAASEKHEAEMAALKKSHAIEAALTDAKAKAVKAVTPYIDADKVSFDSNGNLTGLEEQIKALKEAEDTKFLFSEGAPSIKGAKPGQPGDPEPGGYTKKQILSMPYSKQKEIKDQDPEAYAAIMGQ